MPLTLNISEISCTTTNSDQNHIRIFWQYNIFFEKFPFGNFICIIGEWKIQTNITVKIIFMPNAMGNGEMWDVSWLYFWRVSLYRTPRQCGLKNWYFNYQVSWRYDHFMGKTNDQSTSYLWGHHWWNISTCYCCRFTKDKLIEVDHVIGSVAWSVVENDRGNFYPSWKTRNQYFSSKGIGICPSYLPRKTSHV